MVVNVVVVVEEAVAVAMVKAVLKQTVAMAMVEMVEIVSIGQWWW